MLPPTRSDSPPGNSRLAEELEKIVTKRIAADHLVLPAMPPMAVKVLALTKEADFSLKEAASLIEKDPILAALLLKLASSAAMGAREPIKSVLQAVTRLGVQRLRNFLIEATTRRVFESRDPRISEATKGVWEHSLAVAILARDVVAFSNSGDPEFGYLGGLLHDIGKPIVATMLLEAEKAVLGAKANALWISGTEWVGVIQRCHRRVGVALAEKWEMPDGVCRSIRDCEEYDNSDRLSVANAVRFANAIAKQQGIYVGEVPKDDIDALVMIGRSLLNIDEDVVGRLTAGIRHMVKEQIQ